MHEFIEHIMSISRDSSLLLRLTLRDFHKLFVNITIQKHCQVLSLEEANSFKNILPFDYSMWLTVVKKKKNPLFSKMLLKWNGLFPTLITSHGQVCKKQEVRGMWKWLGGTSSSFAKPHTETLRFKPQGSVNLNVVYISKRKRVFLCLSYLHQS